MQISPLCLDTKMISKAHSLNKNAFKSWNFTALWLQIHE